MRKINKYGCTKKINCKYRYALAKDGHKKYPKHIQRIEDQYKKQRKNKAINARSQTQQKPGKLLQGQLHKRKLYINSSTPRVTSSSRENQTLKDQSDRQHLKDSRGPTQTPKSQHQHHKTLLII